MPNTNTRQWDSADHLETDEDIAAYLNAALEEGDLSLIIATLGDIACAKPITTRTQEIGLTTETLLKLLSPDGTPNSPPC